MSDTGGADANFSMQVGVDADAAAKELEAKLTAAIVAALQSEKVQAAVAKLIKSITKAMKAFAKEQEKAFDATTKAGEKAAKAVGDAFKKTAKQSNAAYKNNVGRGAAPEFAALNGLVESLAKNFGLLATDIRTTNTVLKEMGAGARAQLSAIQREQRTIQQAQTSVNATLNTEAQAQANKLTNATKLQLANIRAQSAADRNASNERIANIRRFTQIATTSIRALTQVFRTVFNGATVVMRNFVNAAQAIFRGLASIVRSTFSAIGATVRTFGTAFGRIFSTMGRGVTGALRGVSSAIRSALSRDESATRASYSRRERMASQSANNQRGILSTIGQTAGIAGGATAVYRLLTSGFERFSGEQRLNQQFLALMHEDQAAVETLLQSISDFARITPFDFLGVADLTRTFLVMGDTADEATAKTHALADALAFSGAGNEELGRLQTVFAQIASQGKVMGNDFIQLANALPALNIKQMLADALTGGDTAALAEQMEKDGAISADQFFEAFFSGIEGDPRVQGAAEELAGTLSGRLANMKESFEIFGASIVGLVNGQLGSAMSKVTDFLMLFGGFVSGEMFDIKGVDLGSTFISGDELSDNMQKLQLFRDVLGDVIKALGLLLALKGVWEVFGLLGRGVALALTPMGLLVVAIAGITAAFGFFRRTNANFAVTWGVVVNQVKPAIEAFQRLGRALKGAFGAGGGDGKPSLLTRIGDGMKYINVYLARLIAGLRVFATILSQNLELKGFEDFFKSLDKAIAGGLAILFFGGEGAKSALGDAYERGGSIILNLLEETFLAPVVRFFRGPFLNVAKTVIGFISNIVGQIASAVGDIWHLVFGGGQDEQDQMLASVLGGPADDRSTGTKILDRLEETFLGPVVRFFRGPFADAIEGVGGFIGGIFQRFLIPGFKAVVDFFAHNFLPGVANIAGAIGRFFAPAIQTLGGLLGQVGTLLAPIGGAIEGFISTWQDEGIGGALSSLWDGISESAGNLWDGEDGNGGIKAGLQSAIDSITEWFSRTFTGKNVSGWITSALNGIRKVGYAIGKFIGSPEFIGTVVITVGAFTAAIAAVLGAFTLGLIQGLAKESVRWGKLIAGALQDGWNMLAKGALSFVPQPVVDAVNAMLGSPIIGTGIALGLGLLAGKIVAGLGKAIMQRATPTSIIQGGPGGGANFATLGLSIAKSLYNSVVSGFSQVGRGAKSLAQMILPIFPKDGVTERTTGSGIGSRVVGGFNSFFRTVKAPFSALSSALKSVKDTAVDKFGSVGTAIATAVIGGIAVFEAGMYAGKRGGAGGVILALLGGAATGGSIGAAFGVPGAAIGAAIGTALAGLGAAIGASGAAAAKAKEEIGEYRDALIDLSDTLGSTDISTNVILANMKEESQQVQDFLIDAQFNARQLASDVLNGTFDLGGTFNTLLNNFMASADASQLSAGAQTFIGELQGALNSAIASGEPLNFQDIAISAAGGDRQKAEDMLKELADAGYDVRGAFDAVNDEASELGKGVELKQLATDLEEVAGSGEGAAVKLLTVDEALEQIRTALDLNKSGAQIADLLNHQEVGSSDALKALSTALDEVESRLNDATAAFQTALEEFKIPGDVAADTSEGMVNSVIAHIPEMQAAYEQMLTPPEGETIDADVVVALKQESQRDFHDKVAGFLAQATKEGFVFDDASMDTWLTDFGNQLKHAGLEGPALDMAMDVINGFIAGDFTSMMNPVVDALNDRQRIRQAAQEMAAEFVSAFGSAADAATALGGPAALGSAITSGANADVSDFARLIPSGTDDGEAYGEEAAAAAPDGWAHGRGRAIAGFRTESKPIETAMVLGGTVSGVKVGGAWVKAIGTGFRASASTATGAASDVTGGVKLAAASGNSGMKSAGFNLGASMAQGIRQSSIVAIAAAITLASRVVSATRATLQIHSPSRVFVTIGRQIGEGFVEGIQDAEVSMTQALETAMTNAIQAAVDTASDEVNRANVATRLFTLLQPSILPDGTPVSDVTSATAKITQQIGEFATELLDVLKDKLSEVLDGLGHADLTEAGAGVLGVPLDLQLHQEDITGQVRDALQRNRELNAYDAARTALNRDLRSGALATRRRARLEGEAYKDLQHDQELLTDKIQNLGNQLARGTITADKYKEKVQALRDAFNTSSLERYHDAMAQIRIDFNKNRLGLEEYNEQLEKLGDRPDALSLTERQAIAHGAGTSLSVGTVIGRANRAALTDAFEKIKDYAQAQIDTGVAATTVTADMAKYVKALRDQAIAMGFNKDQVDALIKAYGLSTASINTLLATYTSLDATTAAGASNVLQLNEQLSAIREYASTLLEAGTPVASVRTSIIALVTQFRTAAVEAGFTAAAVNQLIDDMGLSTSALNAFIAQLNAFTGAANAANAATDAANAGSVVRPVGELHVHVPYGDPEAVGRATVNAMAYGGPTNW